MEPLSEAALGVLRDKTIGDYLHEHCRGTTVFSKLDHGQKLLDHITEQFELAGLPVPQTYTKSVDSVCHRVNKFTTDKTGNFKKEVEASCELVAYVLALRGIDTKKGLLAAIATAAAPAAKNLSHLGRWDGKFPRPTFLEAGGTDFPAAIS